MALADTASIILIVTAVFIRLKLKETPVFRNWKSTKPWSKKPVGQT
ncbi:hypothetical protein [Arthrobacter sp. UYCo732]